MLVMSRPCEVLLLVVVVVLSAAVVPWLMYLCFRVSIALSCLNEPTKLLKACTASCECDSSVINPKMSLLPQLM